MKRFISFLFALMCFSASAQFKPLPPTGSVTFGTTNYLAPDSSIWLGSASKGFTPVVIGNAVKTVTGDLVNLTDSVNPVVNLPGWVNQLRADRVGGLNISEGGSYLLGSSYTDATMLLAGQGTNFNTYTLKFPKLNGVTYKRHMVIFNVNIDSVILESVDNAKIKEVPTKAKVNDIWTLTYDSFSNSWNLEAINSMPKWYIDEKVGVSGTDRQVQGFINGQRSPVTLGWKQLSDLPTPPPFLNGVLIGTAFKPDGSALFGFLEMAMDGVQSLVLPNAFPVYNPGIIGTGGGTLPVADGIKQSDAVNLKQLNERTIPPQPTEGNYLLMSIDGVLTWIPG